MNMEEFDQWCVEGKGTFYIKGQEAKPRHTWLQHDVEIKPRWYTYDVAANQKIKLTNPHLFTVPAASDQIERGALPVRNLSEYQITALISREVERFANAYTTFQNNKQLEFPNPNGWWGYSGVKGLAQSLAAEDFKPSLPMLKNLINLMQYKNIIMGSKATRPLPPQAANDFENLFSDVEAIARLGDYEKAFDLTKNQKELCGNISHILTDDLNLTIDKMIAEQTAAHEII